MYSEKEIAVILSGVVEKLKGFDQKTSNNREAKWVDVPEYWPGYKTACKYAKNIKVHSEIGDFPDELFLVRAPNQTEKEFMYIKANYKQNTLPVFMDYISTMQRPYFDGNWSIDYQKDKYQAKYDGDTMQDYVEGEITPVGSLENYMKMMVTQLKAVDANGVIVIKPKDVKFIETDQGTEVDNGQLFDPVPVYYCIEKKVAFENNKYCLIKTDEKSNVTYANSTKAKGHVFEFYDDTNIWKIVQVGNFTDYKFQFYVYFNHGWNKMPVIELMGVPQLIDDTGRTIWISPFHYAVPSLNNALILTQYQNASIAKCVFPYPVMIGRVCLFEHKDKHGVISQCQGGVVHDSWIGKNIECPGCHGSGLKDRMSPLGQMLINPDSDFNKGENPKDALYFVEPGTGALEFVKTCITQDFEDAKKILHQQTSNSVVKGTENLTATGMTLDTKAMYAFVKTPSDQSFAIWEFILDAIGWMRYGEDYQKAVVVTPATFDYLTDEDYLVQIANAQKAGLPPFVIQSILTRYLQTLYYNEKERAAEFELILNTDRILVLTHDDIMLEYSRRLIHDWEITLHNSAKSLIGELLAENKEFYEQDFEVQKEQLIQKAKESTPVADVVTLQQNAVQLALIE